MLAPSHNPAVTDLGCGDLPWEGCRLTVGKLRST